MRERYDLGARYGVKCSALETTLHGVTPGGGSAARDASGWRVFRRDGGSATPPLATADGMEEIDGQDLPGGWSSTLGMYSTN